MKAKIPRKEKLVTNLILRWDCFQAAPPIFLVFNAQNDFYAFSATQLEWYLTIYFTLRLKDKRFVKQVIQIYIRNKFRGFQVKIEGGCSLKLWK